MAVTRRRLIAAAGTPKDAARERACPAGARLPLSPGAPAAVSIEGSGCVAGTVPLLLRFAFGADAERRNLGVLQARRLVWFPLGWCKGQPFNDFTRY